MHPEAQIDTILQFCQNSHQTCQLMKITPLLAEQHLLRSEGRNIRKIKPQIVEKYRKDMLAGEWTTCYDAVMFDKGGFLRNGQHRFRACIAANHSIVNAIAAPVTEGQILVADSGSIRRDSDYVEEKNSTLIMAIAHQYLCQKENRGFPASRKGGVSRSTKLQCFDRYRDTVLEIAKEVNRAAYRPFISSPAGMGEVLLELRILGWPSADIKAFLGVLDETIEADYSHPANACRRTLTSKQMQALRARIRLSSVVIIAYLRHAWNLYVTGREASIIRLPAVLTRENFPYLLTPEEL